MPVSDYLPTVQHVADLIVSRTKDKYGNEVGTFNSATRPTDTQVTRLIPEMGNRVADTIGDNIPTQLFDDAAGVVAERTAMQIELDYFPEQVNSDRSPYKQMKEQYDADIAVLAKQVEVVEEGGDISAVSTISSNRAHGSFPDSDKFPPYGHDTLW